MQLKYDLICEENVEFKAQLDTMQRQLKEYGDKKGLDVASITDLVCVMYTVHALVQIVGASLSELHTGW